MDKLIQVNKKQEFSTDLIHNIWAPFILKQWKPDLHITCYNDLELPDELVQQFADVLLPLKEKPEGVEVDLGWKFLLKNIKKIPTEVFHRCMDFSLIERSPIKEPYVCLIPNLCDRYCDSRKAVGFSFSKKLWYRLADDIRSRGFKVVVTGIFGITCLQKMDMDKFADAAFIQQPEEKNTYLAKELVYLAGAKAIVGFAGGAHFAPTFGFPGVSSCWRFYDKEYCWPRQSKIGERFNLRVKHKDYYLSDEESREEAFERFYSWAIKSLWDLLGVD